MGIFDSFRKKNNEVENTENRIENTQSQSMNLEIQQSQTISINDDLKGLIWFADGPLKNYINDNIDKNTFDYNGLKITFRMTGDEEPSVIYTKQQIIIPEDISKIERPPYFPTYSGLTPEQKGVYIKLLQNPYDSSIDIGFVFILYYGLERHLLVGDYERACKVILKLRDVHSNKSFQSYSANALVLTSMLHQRGEIALEFIQSLDKTFEYSFSDNLFLLCYYSFEVPINAKDIMRMAKTFEFINMNYIKKYPDVFLEVLEELLIEKYGESSINISKLLSKSDIMKLASQEVPIFANTSIRDKSLPVPMISSNFKLKKEFNILLENAHEIVKKQISGMRKDGLLDKENVEKLKKQLPVFNESEEGELLKNLKICENDYVQRHFLYITLQDFYYKYREVDEKYIALCIDYCWKDIESLTEMENQYVLNEIQHAKEYSNILGNKLSIQEVDKIKETGFNGRIPAFSRLVIIYEKQKRYDEALKICEMAISFKHEAQEYVERKEKILKKMAKEN
jgi:hypothetical protein